MAENSEEHAFRCKQNRQKHEGRGSAFWEIDDSLAVCHDASDSES